MDIFECFVLDSNLKSLPFYVELAGITYPDPHYERSRNCSYSYVLEYVIEGGGYVTVNDKHFYVSAGDAYLLPLGCKCYYHADPHAPFTKIWIIVNGELCRQLLKSYNLNNKFHFKNVDLYDYFKNFLAVCKDRTLPYPVIFSKCSVIFFEIIQALYHNYSEKINMNEYVLNAKHYCDMHIYDKIAVTEIAENIGISVSQLNRLFKKELGTTIYSYILNCRIEMSKSLLKGTAMSISSISDKLNFADEHYFSNIFKKKVGMPPSEYRKN